MTQLTGVTWQFGKASCGTRAPAVCQLGDGRLIRICSDSWLHDLTLLSHIQMPHVKSLQYAIYSWRQEFGMLRTMRGFLLQWRVQW